MSTSGTPADALDLPSTITTVPTSEHPHHRPPAQRLGIPRGRASFQPAARRNTRPSIPWRWPARMPPSAPTSSQGPSPGMTWVDVVPLQPSSDRISPPLPLGPTSLGPAPASSAARSFERPMRASLSLSRISSRTLDSHRTASPAASSYTGRRLPATETRRFTDLVCPDGAYSAGRRRRDDCERPCARRRARGQREPPRLTGRCCVLGSTPRGRRARPESRTRAANQNCRTVVCRHRQRSTPSAGRQRGVRVRASAGGPAPSTAADARRHAAAPLRLARPRCRPRHHHVRWTPRRLARLLDHSPRRRSARRPALEWSTL